MFIEKIKLCFLLVKGKALHKIYSSQIDTDIDVNIYTVYISMPSKLKFYEPLTNKEISLT